MRRIAAVEKFLTHAMKEQITATAEKNGFTVDFFLPEEFTAEMATPYEILYGSMTPEKLRDCKNIKWYCCSFAGVDMFVQTNSLPHEDMLLSNSSGAFGVTIAEHMLMVTLMMMRHMDDYYGFVDADHWMKSKPMRSIMGSRITVLGVGDIGTSFARRVKALGAAHVTGVRRSKKPADDCYDEILTFAELERTLPATDVLAVALPRTPQTDNILNRQRIALLPKTAYVVNVGRGNAIDQSSLVDALTNDRLAGAALDVMVPEPLPEDHPMWHTKNLLLTPHISGITALDYTCRKNVELFCEDLENYAAGRPLKRLVDPKAGY